MAMTSGSMMAIDLAYVRRAVRDAGYSQAQIARDLGVTRQCVNAALNGECVGLVHRYVAALLGEPVERLFEPPKAPGRKPVRLRK
jgi:DNA-binding XRE family transcriptional regulator